MGQSEAKASNKNILVIGVTQLIQLDYIEADWRKDEINSSFDFDVIGYTVQTPHIFLWCPQETQLMKRVIESLINQVLFEGMFYILEYVSNNKEYKIAMKQHRNMIHWLMNEETMRQAVLFVLLVIPLTETPSTDGDLFDQEATRQKIEEELKLSELDSRQPRQLFILNLTELRKDDLSIGKKGNFDFTNLIKILLSTSEKSQGKS